MSEESVNLGLDQVQCLQLGSAAHQYLRERLTNGKTLASLLLKRLDLSKGIITTFLPPYVSEQEAMQFTTGGKLKRPPAHLHRQVLTDEGQVLRVEPSPNTDRCLVAVIDKAFHRSRGAICIFEDAVAERDDPYLKREAHVVTHGTEVYHLLLPQRANESEILNTLRSASSWLTIGMMAILPERVTFSPDVSNFSLDDLKLLVESMDMLFVSAYDGEGYLIWSKNGRPPSLG